MERYTLPAGRDRDVVAAALWAAGAVGVWEREHDLVAWFPARGAAVPRGGTWAHEEERDWTATWKAGLRPVTVGAITVTPSWLVDETTGSADDQPAGRSTIVLDPGMAFGTGHHATTRLCLRELQRVGVDGRRVLDVGTGSGVLAIAAVMLGATDVRAIDTDPDAIEVAVSNARANGARAIDFAVGSVQPGGGIFDVVVANLVTEAILEFAEPLLVNAGSALITSGISAERAHEVVSALGELGARDPRITYEDGWAAVTWRLHP